MDVGAGKVAGEKRKAPNGEGASTPLKKKLMMMVRLALHVPCSVFFH